jgi:hypothetical protein
MTRALKLTTVISLLQPSPEVVALFDDVMLMADGGPGRVGLALGGYE